MDTLLFSRTSPANAAAALESFFEARPANNYVCVSNVHVTVECRRDLRLRAVQNGSFLTIADGQPVIWYGRLSGVEGIGRVMGPDLMAQVFRSPEGRRRRHFFLGGTEETLARMRANLAREFPGLVIAGTCSPPFRPMSEAEEEDLRRRVRETAPDYLWVCFGAPKQEYWMEENHRHFPGVLLVGIGAGFAYHAGELKRAPLLFQKLGCEWVWRLMQDPKRLWKRYFRTNPVFVGLLLARAARRLAGRD